MRTPRLTPEEAWKSRWMRAMPSGYVHYVTARPLRDDFGDIAPTACQDGYRAVWGFTSNFPPLATRCPLCVRLTYDRGAA